MTKMEPRALNATMEQVNELSAVHDVLPCVHKLARSSSQCPVGAQRRASCGDTLAPTAATPRTPSCVATQASDAGPSYVLSKDILGYSRLYQTLHAGKQLHYRVASAACPGRTSSHRPMPQLRVEQTHRLQSFVCHRLRHAAPPSAEANTEAVGVTTTVPPRPASTRESYVQKLAHELGECEAQCRRLDDSALHNHHSLRVNKSSSRHDNTRTVTSRRRVLSPCEQAAAVEARVLDVVKGWVATEETTGRLSRPVPSLPASRRGESRTNLAQGGAARFLFRQMERGRFRVEEHIATPTHGHMPTQRVTNFDQETSTTSTVLDTGTHALSQTSCAVASTASSSSSSSSLSRRKGRGSNDKEKVARMSCMALSGKKNVSDTFLNRLCAEPISCYRPMYHLNTDPPPCQSRRQRRRRCAMAAEGGVCSEAAAHNVAALRHVFDHQRYHAYIDLQDFVDWRATCRAVVQRRICDGAAGSTTPLLDLFARARQTDQGGLCVGRAAAFNSVWTAKACELAVLTERRRLCDKMRAFVPDFDAAALSLEAMEQLRQALIHYVMTKPIRHVRNVLFTVQEMMDFVVRHNKLYDALAHLYRPQPSDVVDAMHSPAEAALVAYLFDSVFTDMV